MNCPFSTSKFLYFRLHNLSTSFYLFISTNALHSTPSPQGTLKCQFLSLWWPAFTEAPKDACLVFPLSSVPSHNASGSVCATDRVRQEWHVISEARSSRAAWLLPWSPGALAEREVSCHTVRTLKQPCGEAHMRSQGLSTAPWVTLATSYNFSHALMWLRGELTWLKPGERPRAKTTRKTLPNSWPTETEITSI